MFLSLHVMYFTSSKTSLLFLGSVLIPHCFVCCKEISGAKEKMEYHPVSNAETFPGFVLIPSKLFLTAMVLSSKKKGCGWWREFVGVSSQSNGTCIMRVVIHSDGRVAVFCM